MTLTTADYAVGVIMALLLATLGNLIINFVVRWTKGTPKKDESGEFVASAGMDNKADESDDSTHAVINGAHDATHRPAIGSDHSDGSTHSWLLTNLKGHPSVVTDLDFSDNGKRLISCGTDGSIIVWNCKDFTEKIHRFSRLNLPFDSGCLIKFSPDNRSFLVQMKTEVNMHAYKLVKCVRNDVTTTKMELATVFHVDLVADVVDIDFASNGKFVMVCSNEDDLLLFDLHDCLLETMSTNMGRIYHARISPCSRYVVYSGFSPDVTFVAVNFIDGGYTGLSHAFTLGGHRSGVVWFDINYDTSRTVTLCKDGLIRLFHTGIDVKLAQEPSLLASVDTTLAIVEYRSKICIAPDSKVICVGQSDDNSLHWFTVNEVQQYKAGRCDVEHSIGLYDSILNVFVKPDEISKIAFSKASISTVIRHGMWLAVSGGKHIRIYKNVPSLRLMAAELRRKLTDDSLSQRLRDGLQSQLDEVVNLSTGV